MMKKFFFFLKCIFFFLNLNLSFSRVWFEWTLFKCSNLVGHPNFHFSFVYEILSSW